jgi:hypothetical protein
MFLSTYKFNANNLYSILRRCNEIRVDKEWAITSPKDFKFSGEYHFIGIGI